MYIFIFEIVGTIAFAISGALVGVEKKMDIFGVAILGLTTAVGGGILRDLILNIAPPSAFQHPVFAVTAIAVSIVFFLPSVRFALKRREKIYEITVRIMDSIGLGLFTVSGVQVALTSGHTATSSWPPSWVCSPAWAAGSCGISSRETRRTFSSSIFMPARPSSARGSARSSGRWRESRYP